MTPLDARLSVIKDMVRPGTVAADIGTDHAYLIAALVEQGICPRGFACDINPGPLACAERTIVSSGLLDKIALVLTSGLAGLPYQEIETVIIAGMGGDLIAEILLSEAWTRDPRFHFLLQPMTKSEHLRITLAKNGFLIQEEKAVACKGHVYTVMSVYYAETTWIADEFFAWTGALIDNRDNASLLYLSNVIHSLEKKAAGLAASANPANAVRYRALAAHIRERIEQNV